MCIVWWCLWIQDTVTISVSHPTSLLLQAGRFGSFRAHTHTHTPFITVILARVYATKLIWLFAESHDLFFCNLVLSLLTGPNYISYATENKKVGIEYLYFLMVSSCDQFYGNEYVAYTLVASSFPVVTNPGTKKTFQLVLMPEACPG